MDPRKAGIVRHRLAPSSNTPPELFKVLNSDYSQKRGRKEMFDKSASASESRSKAMEKKNQHLIPNR